MIFRLVHAEARRRALQAVSDAPDGWCVTVAEQKRNGEQSALLHALLDDIARSGIEWMGKARTADEWKVLMVSGHATATKQGAEMIPGLEGEYVNIRESTARMGKARASSLIEYIRAWMAANDIRESV